jgi:peptidoglycan-associated lipoprotein
MITWRYEMLKRNMLVSLVLLFGLGLSACRKVVKPTVVTTPVVVTPIEQTPRTVTREASAPDEFVTISYIMPNVHFEFNSAVLLTQGKKDLEWLVAALAQQVNQSYKVIIVGHCDERGSDAYNLVLGLRRANSVKKYLVSKGIAADLIDTRSAGKSSPLDPGHNQNAWARNRRAVVTCEAVQK